MNKNQKGFSAVEGLLILVIVGLLGFVGWYVWHNENNRANDSTTASSNKFDYPNTSIFYDDGSQVWQINPKTNIRKKIANGTTPDLSPDKTRLSFVVIASNTNGSNLRGVHIYDIKTGQDKIIYPASNDFNSDGATWSPSGAYLVVDDGTSPIRSKTIIDSATGKELASFTTHGSQFSWLDDKQIVFTDMQKVEPSRPWEGGLAQGIATIDVTGHKKVLQTATKTQEYSFIHLLDSGKIYYSLSVVPTGSQAEWQNQQAKGAYWTMDASGSNQTQVQQIESLDAKIQKTLPPPYNQYKPYGGYDSLIAKTLSSDKKWVVISFYQTQSGTQSNQIYVMNTDNPKSIKAVADKAYTYTW